MPDTLDAAWVDQPGPVTGPLRGVRVLDLTTVVMGPFATQILGDLGADVVKIETAGGDSMRGIGPWVTPGMGPLYLWANRNKRSVVLDLKSPEGKAAIITLAESADVLVSNVRPQGLARLGLDYETLRKANPQIIFCSAVGYGAGGPQSGKAVYDDLMQAAAGISGLFQQVDGAPRYAPANFCDRIVGLYVVNSITAALYHKAMTGEGQEIEVPMFETMAQFVLSDHVGGKAFEPRVGEMGYKRLLSRTRGPYPTKDGFIAVVVYTNKHWEAFGKLIGQPDVLTHDPRFETMAIRNQNSELMGSFLSAQLQERTTAEWLTLLDGIDIPACPVNSLEDLFTDPHLKAVDFFSEMEHPTEGTVNVARFPVKYSGSPASIRRLAPNLGEHNKDFLRPGAPGDLQSAPGEAAE
jgi:crotonobetainyl-CoA:carnitine CoA-transferase CaiB-like acyl-CoA transferase